MKREELMKAVLRLRVQTGSLVCLGCGHENNCGIHGCAILRGAADCIQELTAKLDDMKKRYDEINDFDQSQSAKLLMQLAKLLMQLAERDEQLAAAVCPDYTPPDNKVLTERDTAMVCGIRTTNRGIDVSGEYDIDSDFICPSCGFVVGDAEGNELHGTFCNHCGQRLSVPAEED